MLTQDGELTDIGSWYLGGNKTGNIPKGGAGCKKVYAGSGLMVLGVSLWSLV